MPKSKSFFQIFISCFIVITAGVFIVKAATTIGTNISTGGDLTVSGTITQGTWNGSTIGVAYGGTASTTLSGILKGNGVGMVATAVADTDYLLPATAATLYAPLASPTFTGLTTLANATSSQLTTTGSTYLATAGGSVGIGTTGPGRKLTISDTSGVDVFMSIIAANTKSSNILFGDTDQDYTGRIKYNHATNDMTFNIGNTQRVSFLSGGGHGYFGFGNVTPSVNMEIRDGIADTGTRLYLMPNGSPTGLQSGIKMFGTDWSTGSENYNDFGLWAGDDFNYINSKQNGTGVAKDFLFSYNDVNPLMIVKITGYVGIGTSTPSSLFTASAGASATTTVEFGDQYSASSKACFNTKNTAGTAISFYFVGTTMVVESNRCR